MPTINEFVIITLSFFFVGLLGGYLGHEAWLAFRRTGKVRILWYDPDSQIMKESYVKPEGNEFTHAEKRYILDAAGKIASKIPTWILHPRHGWNYVGLSDAATIYRDDLLMKLSVSSPALYHKQLSRNQVGDSLTANLVDGKDPNAWIVPVAIVGATVLLGVLGVVVYIAYKIRGG
jgi:hypothetical protein